MNQITDEPNTYTFGQGFNYSNWPKNTQLTLCNVDWNNDYRDIVRFNSQDALNSWIDSQSDKFGIDNASQKRFQRPTVRINTPMNRALRYNYLRAANPLNPVNGDIERDYYYFILDVAFISGNTTELTLQLDVWQTFGYEVKFGRCYVERGHIGIANENAFTNYGRDYLNVPEGLDVGGEYRIVKTAQADLMTITNYSVLMVTTADLTKGPGTLKAPKLSTATGSVVDGIVSGATFYVFPTPGDYLKFQRAYAPFPWITQSIVSVTMIPPVDRYHQNAGQNVAPLMWIGNGVTYGPNDDIPAVPDWVVYEYPDTLSTPKTYTLAENWRDTFLNVLPVAYRGLKKFLTYPYCVIELTTWTGRPLVARPEAWADANAAVRELAVMVPPGQRVAIMPLRYNADPATDDDGTDDNGESLDFATTIDSFPTVPLVNNMAIGYLASNARGLAFQFRSADWSQQRALMGAQAMQDIAGEQIADTGRQTSAGVTAVGAQAQLDMETQNNLGIIGGALGIAGVGVEAQSNTSNRGGRGGMIGTNVNPLAMAGYDATAGIRANSTSQAAAIAQARMGASALSSIQASGAIRDTNVGLARRAAQGDYANMIAGINARVQDAALTQPSTSGQFGGDAMNIAHNKMEISARFKLIDKSAVRRIGNYWLRYGYAVAHFIQIPDDFMCMSKFTYWKLSETYITQGRIPETFKQTIRGIFEKGVTVWADPDDIGRVAFSANEPRTGVSY